ncbi:protein bunched, class 2/F/G isoform isoform X2 [Nilaparvata lugens]|uniref:protein bunched, class 2/F/G isoform isoform X2 n=1 Tax=Nilaparvata lugens TaxID=108931 RepID=UPI000B97E3D2|nr:protein bunched, class 2/F/G isoform isoform X2 [Nilaparvata lugens]
MAEKSQKTSKGLEKNKYSNAVNRTTSESLRLGESDKPIAHPTTLISSATNAKKKTSFQITSVTVGSRTSNDGGEDSADDLDESHTEDISDVVDVSRVTDIGNETPSYSEDTFSKDDVFFNTSASLGTAPVIPTSSQYGLAIVDANENCGNSPSACVNNIAGSELHVTVPDSVINIVGVKHNETEMRDIHSHPGRNERFKVVKIESTEPFKRGRWICMDYLDHSMIQSQQTQANVSNLPVKEQIENVHSPATVGHQATDSGICLSDMNSQNMNSVEDKVPLNVDKGTQQDQQQSNVQYINQNSGQTNTGAYSNPSPGQTMQSQPVSISSSQAQMLQQHIQSMSLNSPMNQNMLNTNQHQSLQAQQMQQVIASANMQMPQVPLPQQLGQPVQMQHLQQFQQPQQVQQQVIQPMQPVHSIQSQPMQVPQTIIQTIPQQPISAPANYPPTSAHIAQTIQMPVQTQPSPQTYPVAAGGSLQQCPPGMISVQQHPMQQPQYYTTTQGISMMPSQQQPPQMMTIPTQVPHQQTAVGMQQPYAMQPQQQQQQAQSQGQQQQQQMHHVPTTSMAGYAPVPTAAQVVAAVSQAAASMVPTSQSAATQMIQQMYGTVMQGQMFRNGAVPSSVVDAITSEPGVIERVVQSTGILETLANVASINNNDNSETPAAGEDPESTSGASAVAIDNKIEQAMDLVKSHLMFAVREEVEVLKEKIAELMDRINHLEFENSFLKANATQETLAQLSSMPQPPSSSGAP